MSSTFIGLVGILVFLLLCLAGLPIADGMLTVGLFGFMILSNPNAAFRIVAIDLFSSYTSYNMSVVAMFTWMGCIALHTGIGEKLFDAANRFIGHLPGGLAMASEVACAMFGAVCGSGPATTSTIGSIALPQMKRYGYDDAMATGAIAAGGGLGLLIPPSMLAIVYGVITEQSIGRLFIAGVGAGILCTVLFCITIFIKAKRHPEIAPKSRKYTAKERIEGLGGGVIETLIVFIVSIGGLSAGFFTPTEGGAIGAFAMLAVVLIRRKLTWKGFIGSLKDTVKTVGMVLYIVASATMFGRFIALAQIPTKLSAFFKNANLPPVIALGLILLIYFIGGMFIDSLPMVLLTVPIFYPIITGYGYDPIWFGVIIVLICCVGMVTPPVGVDAYVAKNVAKTVPLQTVFKGIWPFVAAMVIAIALCVVFPDIILFLPNLLMGKV